jgi:hypothetical protein
MDPVHNPYQPGAGRRPPELAGRDTELRAFDVLMQRSELGHGERGRILYGLRGVGKTVLLNEFQGMAEQRHWITAKLEAAAGRSVLPYLAQSLHRSLRIATGRFDRSRVIGLLQVFRSFTVKVDPTGTYSFGFDVQAVPGRADTGDPAVDLPELFTALGSTASDLGVGVLLLVDEMQEVPAQELRALNSAVHELGQGADPRPVVLVGAGLPSLPEMLSKATSYAERLYEYLEIGPLARAAAHDALVVPAAALGVQWTPDALARLDSFSHGYPYFVQTGGKYAWDYAAESPITAADVEAGLVQARREVDAGLYRARWQRATPNQRLIMRAMSDLAGDSPLSMATVAETLGKERNELSVPRDQLIKKGLIYAPSRGLIAFTVPGMAEYVSRQPD